MTWPMIEPRGSEREEAERQAAPIRANATQGATNDDGAELASAAAPVAVSAIRERLQSDRNEPSEAGGQPPRHE
jgi:hypothetical protein